MKFNDNKSKIYLKEKYCIISTPIEFIENSVKVAGDMINRGWIPVSGVSFDDGKIFHTLVKEPNNV
ncbi:MAG: hypothetical protein CMG19_04920 [Candidatus Marinimicrobia bacterium]|nr:hypothetical protein [Candidatus Neomarinimicrobiota bacterium]